MKRAIIIADPEHMPTCVLPPSQIDWKHIALFRTQFMESGEEEDK